MKTYARLENWDWGPKQQYLLSAPQSMGDAIVCALVLVIALALAFGVI